MTFNDWFNGQELYGLRSERLHAMLDAFSSKDLLFQALLPWFEQAYEQGRSDEEAAAELRRLHTENDKLKTALRRVIRTYMVADDAWDHDAELERLYQREMKT